MANGMDPNATTHLDAETQTAVARRKKLLGPAYRLFYSDPVEIVRGKGVYLYDHKGNEFLDAYNNVVSVGHSHPKVVAAITQQLEKLCTHTRYIQQPLLNFSEQLLATHHGALREAGHTMFTCTGSESNDLAMRIARYHTGRKGVIVTAEAYHGNSATTAGFSPSLGRKSPLDPFVRTVAAPDSYRLPPEKLGEIMAADVQRQIDDLARHGEGLAAFIADSLFSSDGLYSQPTDLLAPVAKVVKAAGGLFIADEVQSGFGRSGSHMWGYQRHGIDPDIVTMGKPMGNGYPVAGIVVRHDIVAAFGKDMRYFNTFGGNTVAIAAAQATLDVIQQEGLMENSLKVGRLIHEGLLEIARRYHSIGDVRSAGLYFGVELVQDRESKVPDMDLALAIVNGLRRHRVLISATGAQANILKIRPPLVFTENNALRLLETIDCVFAEFH
ncbi:TPA: aspartate aminotransferase family protein [Klebsiella variicola subsp. variicola]|uniref:aspartate aminotransferase family protein n=1 Tax=Klebsiella sp. JB_Kp010 TaxID=3153363 RepID=UPI0032B54381|nr:aspartate aminotransferase family protein [Klebsiella variicola subsp. variicola]HCI6746658.1 aspartate aminotransferase family protein [Klebsiella variicola subsp. variicola]